MLRKILLIGIVIAACLSIVKAQRFISGKVVDAKTKAPLAFVSITITGEQHGTQSDIDGKFSIRSLKPVRSLTLSYVGYESIVHEVNDADNILISLQPKAVQIKEVTVRAGENPAHRIIRKAIDNRDHHNPEKYTSFSYTSYNKFVITGVRDTTRKNPYHTADLRLRLNDSRSNDSLYIDSLMLKREKAEKKADSFFNAQHLFLAETATDRIYLHPGFSKETIKASRISGLKNPGFVMMASQFQSFSFYNDYIKVADKNYLSPLAIGSFNKYFFNIEDTAYTENDTVFIISFKPGKNTNFRGLKGLIYINTDGFAVQNVIAEPAEKEPVSLKIQQLYEKIEGKYWFPTQLNTDVTFGSLVQIEGKRKPVGIGRSYLENIKIGVPVDRREVGSIAVEMDQRSVKETDNILLSYRNDTLSAKDRQTYVIIDSVGEKIHLDRIVNSASAIGTGFLPWKFLNIDLASLLNYNEYEKLRVGFGAVTNERVFKHFSIGGYAAYGLADKAFKYGGSTDAFLYRRGDVKLSVKYANDVFESGRVNFYNDKRLLSEGFRNLLVKNMDKVGRVEGSLTFRSLNDLLSTVFLREDHISVTNSYSFGEGNLRQFSYAEAGICLKFAFREKFALQGNQKLSLGTDYPLVWLQVTNGMNNFSQRKFAYLKYDLKILKSFLLRNVGKTTIRLAAGFVDGNVPYPVLYSGRANYNGPFSLVSANSFETMRMNEFLSSRYGAVFFSHHFGKLIYKSEKFQPELQFVSNMGWGELDYKDKHKNYTVKTMEKGFYESGLVLNQVLRLKSVGFSHGFGIGTFYRYGPYTFSSVFENFAFKVSYSIEL